MLNRLSDYYRIVNPSPSDVVITQRQEAIATLLTQISEPNLMNACVEIAAFGPYPVTNSSQKAATQVLMSAIQEKQPSFTSDVVANALDIQVCAAVALGEYLSVNTDQDTWKMSAVASLVVCALAMRAPVQERHLTTLLDDLLDVAHRVLDREGRDIRRRQDIELGPVQGNDAPALVKSINSELQSLKKTLTRNLRVDREELNILWWVFGAQSIRLLKPFLALEIGARAVAAGEELADLTLLPPTSDSSQFLLGVLKEEQPLTIRQVIQSCPQALLEAVARRRKTVEACLSNHPSLLPFTWLCVRKLDSGVSSGWESEFELKTHISPEEKRPASQWSLQTFNECIAARILSQLEVQE